MIPKSNLVLAAATAACAGLGFLAGQGLGEKSESKPDAAALFGAQTERAESGATESSRAIVFPSVDAFAPEDFSSFARELAAVGRIDADFAQWLGLVFVAREDLRTSMDIARREDLLVAWADGAGLLDPEATVELLRTLPLRERDPSLHALISALGRTDPERGLALIQGLPESLRPDAFRLFANWAERSVPEAASAAAAIEDEHLRSRALGGVFHVWGLHDRRGMLEWALDRGTAVGRQAFFAAYEGPGFRDPELALEFAQDHPEIASWNTVVAMADGLVQKGASGWDAILDLPPGALRAELLMRGASAQARKDPTEAWRICLSLPPEDQQLFLRLSTSALGRTDPRATVELLHRVDSTGDFSARGVLNRWAESNAPAALEWTRANFQGLSKSRAIGGIFSAWIAKDPAQAVRALDSLPAGTRAMLLPDVARGWSTNAPSAALAWANKLPALDRTRAVDAVLAGWSQRDPLAAAVALGELPPDGLNDAYNSVAWNLGSTKPKEAVRWAEDLGTPDLRARVIEDVTRAWSRHDAAAASEYLTTLQRGEYRDAAISGFIWSVAELDPAAASEWAGAVDDPVRRENVIRSTIPHLKAHSAVAARAFVEGLSDRRLREKMQTLVE